MALASDGMTHLLSLGYLVTDSGTHLAMWYVPIGIVHLTTSE